MRGEAYRLKLGWHVVKNLSAAQRKEGLGMKVSATSCGWAHEIFGRNFILHDKSSSRSPLNMRRMLKLWRSGFSPKLIHGRASAGWMGGWG